MMQSEYAQEKFNMSVYKKKKGLWGSIVEELSRNRYLYLLSVPVIAYLKLPKEFLEVSG